MNNQSKEYKRGKRLLEIILGAFSPASALLFFVTSFLFPFQLAYIVLVFDAFWLYKSASLGITTMIAHLRIKASQALDWLGEAKVSPDWKKIHHVVLLVTVKEPLHTLERAVQSLADQDFPTKQMSIVLAMEERVDPKERNEKANALKKKFGKKFANFFVTAHRLAPGETIGKHSNENFAARWVRNELIDKRGFDIDYLTVTSCDADHCFHRKHFSYLTYSFLDSPNRYTCFWQPAVVFYNNYWKLPAITRVVNTFSTIWQMAVLVRTDRLISCQNYSLSLKLLDQIGYWDPDVIPEDYHLFFKAFFETKGKIEVKPIYLPLMADAAESTSTWKTIKNTYQQYKRWSWGISDDPNVIIRYFTTPGMPFITKTIRLIRLLEDHLLMPVNWFFITLGVTIPSLILPEFSRTAIGYNLPKISSTILSLCLISLGVVFIVNAKQRPPRPKDFPLWRAILIPLEFILMPVAGFFFSALPSLDAHTRLMLGKYLEYKVTEKV